MATSHDVKTLRPGDILVTRSPTFNSAAIAAGTCSNVSHAILALDSKTVIEAIPGPGVHDLPYEEAFGKSSSMILLRHKHILFAQGVRIAEFAKAQIGKSYDSAGAGMAGYHSACGRRITRVGLMIRIVEAVTPTEMEDKAFFCTELIARAYQSVGLKVAKGAAALTLPSNVIDSDLLEVVAKLK